MAVLALRFDASERVNGRRLTGLVLGLAGVVALVGIDVAGHRQELLGVGAVLMAAIGYASGPLVLKRRLTQLDPRATAGASLGLASMALAPLAALTPPTETPSTAAILALVALGLLCTAAAFVILPALVAEAGASRVSIVTYINPIVALAFGIAILEERPGLGAVVGLFLIITGSWLATDGRRPRGLRQPARKSERNVHDAQSTTSRHDELSASGA